MREIDDITADLVKETAVRTGYYVAGGYEHAEGGAMLIWRRPPGEDGSPEDECHLNDAETWRKGPCEGLRARTITVMDRLCPRCDAVAVRDEPGKNPDLEQVLARVPTETRLTFADGAPKIERSRVGDATHLVVTHEPWCEAGPAKLEEVAGGGWN